MKVVLFVCNHNAGRSQMAEAFFQRDAPPDVRAESAGSNPARAIYCLRSPTSSKTRVLTGRSAPAPTLSWRTSRTRRFAAT